VPENAFFGARFDGQADIKGSAKKAAAGAGIQIAIHIRE
jgi:hypothetical protein